jgi:hypothetical protein
MPAKRSGRYGNTPLRYYSAKSTLVLAFHTGSRRPPSQPGVIAAPAVTANQQQQQQHGIITSPTADHHGDGSTFWSSAANGNTNSSSLGPYGFKGTYRFIRKSRTSFCTQSVFPPGSIRSSIFHTSAKMKLTGKKKRLGKCFLSPIKIKRAVKFSSLLGSIDHSWFLGTLATLAKMSTSLIASSVSLTSTLLQL